VNQRVTLIVIGLLATAACDRGSQLDEAQTATAKNARVTSLELAGGLPANIVGLYVDRFIERLVRKCKPEPGTTARLSLTVGRKGHIDEVGIRSSAPAFVPCARTELAGQRFPKTKKKTLVSASVEF